ncbi:uncharacterized protein LTR77_007701 [Saxophila tyrrhenica]|uniref:Uncharacterized protein n=1 Tax=Saxophila tyrrhenica TaxID=1690608 RepID=A0AAV9P5T4_9PEZI|nr:hypothetical protein LTR77_007701 [Saxophila tyrrhenica]
MGGLPDPTPRLDYGDDDVNYITGSSKKRKPSDPDRTPPRSHAPPQAPKPSPSPIDVAHIPRTEPTQSGTGGGSPRSSKPAVQHNYEDDRARSVLKKRLHELADASMASPSEAETFLEIVIEKLKPTVRLRYANKLHVRAVKDFFFDSDSNEKFVTAQEVSEVHAQSAKVLEVIYNNSKNLFHPPSDWRSGRDRNFRSTDGGRTPSLEILDVVQVEEVKADGGPDSPKEFDRSNITWYPRLRTYSKNHWAIISRFNDCIVTVLLGNGYNPDKDDIPSKVRSSSVESRYHILLAKCGREVPDGLKHLDAIWLKNSDKGPKFTIVDVRKHDHFPHTALIRRMADRPIDPFTAHETLKRVGAWAGVVPGPLPSSLTEALSSYRVDSSVGAGAQRDRSSYGGWSYDSPPNARSPNYRPSRYDRSAYSPPRYPQPSTEPEPRTQANTQAMRTSRIQQRTVDDLDREEMPDGYRR